MGKKNKIIEKIKSEKEKVVAYKSQFERKEKIEKEKDEKQKIEKDKQNLVQNVYSTPNKESKIYGNISNKKNNIQIKEEITQKTQTEKNVNKPDKLKSKSLEKIEVKKYIYEQSPKNVGKNYLQDKKNVEKDSDSYMDKKRKKEEQIKTWRFHTKNNIEIEKENTANILEKKQDEKELKINKINNIYTNENNEEKVKIENKNIKEEKIKQFFQKEENKKEKIELEKNKIKEKELVKNLNIKKYKIEKTTNKDIINVEKNNIYKQQIKKQEIKIEEKDNKSKSLQKIEINKQINEKEEKNKIQNNRLITSKSYKNIEEINNNDKKENKRTWRFSR